MKKITCIMLCFFVSACSIFPATELPITLIENVTTIDGRQGARANVDVIIIDGVIKSIGPKLGSKYRNIGTRIEGTGKYLIPGLWDAHVHLAYTPGVDHTSFFPLSIAHGVTSLRDTGGHLNLLAPAREAAAQDPLSPDLYISGPLVDGALRIYDGHSTIFADLSVSVSTPEEGREMVDKLAAQGVDFIKAYEMITPEVLRAVVSQAKSHDLAVTAHIPLLMSIDDVIKSDVKDMQHLRNLELACTANADTLLDERTKMIAANDAPFAGDLRSAIHAAQRSVAIKNEETAVCNSVISLLAQNEVIQTPTLVTTRFFTRPFFQTKNFQKTWAYMPAEIAKIWRVDGRKLAAYKVDENMLAYDEWAMGMVGRLNAAGVPIMAGTDAPIAYLTPGVTLHEELFMLVESGLTPQEAIKAASYTPASFLGIHDKTGSIAPNMVADLVLLNENPLEDIRNIGSIETVFKNGHVIDRVVLDALLSAPSKIELTVK